MKCFNHRTLDSIGFCKQCGKGLCDECVREAPSWLSCTQGECVQKTDALEAYLERSVYKPGASSSVTIFLGMALVGVGLVFLIDFASKTTVVAGLAFLAAGLVMLWLGGRHFWEKRLKGSSGEARGDSFQAFQKVYEEKKQKRPKKDEKAE